jgi:ABC-type phosphate/phosphonate transport system substrate-binding protein
MAYLIEHGIDPQSYFGKVTFARDHVRLLRMIASGEADVGATCSSALPFLESEAERRKIAVLAKTGRIPYSAYVSHARVPAEMVGRIQEALINLNTRTAEGRRELRGRAHLNGFIEVDDAYYDEVRRVQDTLKKARDRDIVIPVPR